LIRYWDRLQHWLGEDRVGLQLRQEISDAASAWEAHLGNENYLVHRHGRMSEIRALQRVGRLPLNDAEARYVAANAELDEREAQAERDRSARELQTAKDLAGANERARQEAERRSASERRAGRLFRWLSVGLAILVAIASGTAWYARDQRDNANEQKATAEANAAAAQTAQADAIARLHTARSRELAVMAGDEAGANLDRALLLDMEALNVDGTFEANNRLLDDILVEPKLNVFLNGHTGQVTGVAFHPNGTTLASSSDDGTIRLWDMTTGDVERTLMNAAIGVNSLAFNSDGSLLASAGDDGTITIWDVGSGRRTHVLRVSDEAVTCVVFSPVGPTVAAAGADGVLLIWNWEANRREIILNPSAIGINSVAFSPDGAKLATGDAANQLRLWNVSNGQELPGSPLRGHTREVWSVAFSPDGSTLATGSDDGTIKRWDAVALHLIDTLEPEGDVQVYSVVFSPDGTTLATGTADNRIHLWNLETGKLRDAPLTGHAREVRSLAFNAEGTRLASGGADARVILYDMPAQGSLIGHYPPARSTAFSPDGATLASGGKYGVILLWDVESRAQIGTLSHGEGWATVRALAFSPNDAILASGAEDGQIDLWDVSDRNHPVRIGTPLTGHTSHVTAVAFSPDGKTIASASADTTVRLWNVETGQMILAQPLSHRQPVNSVAFNRDGSLLASAGWDQVISLWSSRNVWAPCGDIPAKSTAWPSARITPYWRQAAVTSRSSSGTCAILAQPMSRSPATAIRCSVCRLTRMEPCSRRVAGRNQSDCGISRSGSRWASISLTSMSRSFPWHSARPHPSSPRPVTTARSCSGILSRPGSAIAHAIVPIAT
jgi:WD40 repeat protein